MFPTISSQADAVPLGVAVIGLGIGRRHVQAYRQAPGVQVLAVADTDAQALQRARAELAIPHVYSDYRQILERRDVQAVSICTPDGLHAEQALAALAAGKHVLCEKPMALTLADAGRIVQAARASGLTFQVGHNYRFIPQFVRLKQLVEEGAVGPLYFGECNYVQDLYFMEQLSPEYWRLKDPQDFYLGGAVHNVDLLRWVVGEIEEVSSYSTHVMPFYRLDDNYVSAFRFAGGQIGQLKLLLGSRLKDQFIVDITVQGPEGSLKAVMQRDEVIHNRPSTEGAGVLVEPVVAADSFALEIAHFVECVRSGEAPRVGAEDGARAVAICLAAIRSAREGRAVKVDYGALPA